MPKKVVWDLDSDDEIIVQMKQEKYTDKEVVERLIKEGRTKYHHKTISSRWVRLKRVLAAHEDELLDAQLTDWHEGDVSIYSKSASVSQLIILQDDLLLEAITSADQEVYQRKQKVAEEKWKVVAEFLKASKPTTNYSQNACRNRFEALENDTATIPPELVDFPERCRVQRVAAEETYATGFGGVRQQHNNLTFEGDVGTGDHNHETVLPKSGIGKSKIAGTGHGKARTAQLFPRTSLSVAQYHSVDEDMKSSDNDSGADYEEQSDASVKLSPNVKSLRNRDNHKSRLARAAVPTISVASTNGRVRGKMGASTISQHGLNVTSDVGTARVHPERIPLFARAAGRKPNNCP